MSKIYSLNFIAYLEMNNVDYELYEDEETGKFYASCNVDVSELKKNYYREEILQNFLNCFRLVKVKIKKTELENNPPCMVD